MRRYETGAHIKKDLKVHLLRIPKYHKRVSTGEVAIRVHDILLQIAFEHELNTISGKIGSGHIHMFISYRPTQNISKKMQWLKGSNSRILRQEIPLHSEKYSGRHLWQEAILLSALEILLMNLFNSI